MSLKAKMKKPINTNGIQILSLFGKLLEISTPWLLKNLPFLKLTLFIEERAIKIMKGAISPIGFNSNAWLIIMLKKLRAHVAILNKLSRDILNVCMVINLKTFIYGIVLQRRLSCKRVIAGILIILSFSNSYAISQESLQSKVTSYEKKYNIPNKLLWSIASVESKNTPLALNISGKPYFPKSAKEAMQIIESAISEGITNIDVGLMQVNLKYHGENFRNISEMLDIDKNLNYAAQLLCKLYKIHGGWREAVQHYHSNKSEYHRKYAKKVLFAWLES